MSSAAHKQKIWNFIKDIKVGMLVTQDGEDLRARPMHIVQKDYDGTLWFFTKRSAEKVCETQKESDVCVTFCDHDNGVHVSLTGRAHVTQDKTLIDKFWNMFSGAWFEHGRDDPDVALLEIKISKGEHWEADENKVVQLYEIITSNIGSGTPDIGENEKFG